MSDVLRRLGLDAEDDEHPANTDVLRRLGIEPDIDEHPATKARPTSLVSPEVPFRPGYSNVPDKTRLQRIREAIDPWTVIPAVASDIGGNVAEAASGSATAAARGAGKMVSGEPATGLGEAALGSLGVAMSPLTGAVKSGENALTNITGNPEFASRAALMFPMNVGGPAARTAAHNVHPTTRAADEIARIAGPENVPTMLNRLQTNPRLRFIDTSDQLRMAGQGLISSPNSPAASRTLTENMRSSAKDARDAVRGTYNEAMGSPPSRFDEYQRLENKAKAIGQSKIAPPLITAGPVDTSSVLVDIDKILNPVAVKMTPGTTIPATPLQQRLTEFRRDLASDTEVLTDASRLHALQADLRREADDLMSSATGSDRRLGRQLMDYRDKLVDAIDKSADGYKEGLKAYRDQKDIQRAFDFGRDVLKNTDDVKTDPSYLKNWLAGDRTKEEIEAAKLGARSAVESKMGSIKQSALDPGKSGTDVPQVEFNKQKLEMLFGKENTDKMFRHLSDERDIALTNNRGLGNSKTAETRAYQQHLEPRDISKPTSQLPSWALTLGTGAGVLSTSPTVGALVGGGVLAGRSAKAGYDWLARRNEIKRNASIADLITRNDPEARALMSIAAQRVGQRNKLQNLIAPP